jgi:hypothetical protein
VQDCLLDSEVLVSLLKVSSQNFEELLKVNRNLRLLVGPNAADAID